MDIVYTKEQIEYALIERYTKQKQQILYHGNVAVAGLGGLGSHVAIALARMGVGNIHIIDYDIVDITNLNRQQYFLNHIGMYKTEALRQQILNINPYINIDTDCIKVTEQNIKQLFCNNDIICEAFDNAESKAMLVNGILEYFPEKKLVAASGLAGYQSSNIIHTRRISKNFYLCGDEVTEISEQNVLTAPRAGLCACHQSNMIIRLLLGEEQV